ncbi:hypothetical protein SH467x_001000 [Pirellulaceae bacterium SH467]|jgi:hypothetical protein
MISKRVDRWIEWTKWPVATLATLTLPITLVSMGRWLYASLASPVYLVMFLAGLGLILFASRTSFASSRVVRTLFRLLHDATQVAVATLLFHPVVAIRRKTDAPDLSRVRWLGKGNWVLLAAPYAFPLSTLLVWIPSVLLFAPLRSAMLGFGLGLHWVYLVYHWRTGTSELRRLGNPFCWMFLPAVNLLIAGGIFAFAIGGFSGVGNFLVDWFSLPWDTWNSVRSWLESSLPSPKAS